MWSSSLSSHYEKFLATGEVKCIDEEIPFEIPEGWEWCRLGLFSEIIGGYAFDSSSLKATSGERVIRISDINESGFVNNKIVRYSGTPIAETYRIRQFDILMAMTGGTVGKSLYVKEMPEDSLLLNQRVAIIRNRYIDSDYLDLVIKAPHIMDVINSRKNSTNDNISMVDIYKFLIPVPAVAHQKAIVKGYTEILPLLHRFDIAQNELDLINQRITPILKKSILQEAIQGKLVPQIPKEGTAQELLEQIRQEKQRLFKEGKLKKSALSDSVIFKGDDNKYYEQVAGEPTEIECDLTFPDSWSIVRLGSICCLIDGEKANGMYPCLDAKFLRGKSTATMMQSGKFVHKDDNIILVDGENSGEVFRVPTDGYMGSTFKQLWVSSQLYLPYILDFILFYKEQLRNSKRGAAIPHLNKDIFYNLIIGIPPIAEQKRITYRIDELSQLLK
ncbi:restriction endonuclease subunit S [Bacteroides congonensis]